MDISSVRRTQVPHDGDDIRLYYLPGSNQPPMPSVSTVKRLRVDPEKEDALEGWRNRYDGQSAWARPWWKDQRQYKAYRGTLVHFAILDAIADASGDTYFHEVGDTDWGYEEYYAEYCLKKWSTKAPSANTDEVPYTPRNNQYDGEHAWDKAVREMKWAANAFNEQIIQTGHLPVEQVQAVEQFLFGVECGYAGQFDLLYEDGNGDTVLSDIKTSSAVRFDHKLQAAAYKHLLEATSDVVVDRCEIIRLYPDDEIVEVSSSDEWDRSLQGLTYEFLGLVDHAQTVAYQETLQEAKQRLMDTTDDDDDAE